MKEKIRDIISDEKQFENVLETSMEKVGKKRDQNILGSINNMKEDDFSKMIEGLKGDDIHVELPDTDGEDGKVVPLWRRTYIKLIAACVVAICLIGIANQFNLSAGDNQYASLFGNNGKFDKIEKQLQEFKIGDNRRVNGKGGRTTAAILEESAEKICDGNVRETKEGVSKLKELLTLNYNPALESEIHWYLGMGYLKLNQPTDAKIELEYVKKRGGVHANEASSILKQIWDIQRKN